MITSRLTGKGRTTIPRAVRAALDLRAGDAITYGIDGRSAVLTKAQADAALEPFATFAEWRSEADRLAYADL